MKKDGRSRRSFNEAVGRADDMPWHIIKCPQCADKDATQNPVTWWCRECGWGKDNLEEKAAEAYQGPVQQAPQAPPSAASPQAQPPAPERAPGPTDQPKPPGISCRVVVTKRK